MTKCQKCKLDFYRMKYSSARHVNKMQGKDENDKDVLKLNDILLAGTSAYYMCQRIPKEYNTMTICYYKTKG